MLNKNAINILLSGSFWMYVYLLCKQLKDAFQLEVSQTMKELLFLHVLTTMKKQAGVQLFIANHHILFEILISLIL